MKTQIQKGEIGSTCIYPVDLMESSANDDVSSDGETQGNYQNTGGRGYGDYASQRGRGGFGGHRPFRPSPVRVDEKYDVKIESLSRRGDSGVARIQGLVVFVPESKVGDNVTVKITKVGQGYATAEIVENDTGTEAQISHHQPHANASNDSGSEAEDGTEIESQEQTD